MDFCGPCILDMTRATVRRFEQAQSPFALKTNSFSEEPPAALIECRRKLLNKTNHLQPDRRRLFYLAILKMPYKPLIQKPITSPFEARKQPVLEKHHFARSTCIQRAARLQPRCWKSTDEAMSIDQRSVILAAVERAPDWVRRDLVAKDEASRQRAEESLAAIVASALQPQSAT